jgi:hypothetical protein
MRFEILMFAVQLKVGGEMELIMGVQRVQGQTPSLHMAPSRSDMLLTAYQGEHIRYHGRSHGQARGYGVALKGGVNVANVRSGSQLQEWG